MIAVLILMLSRATWTGWLTLAPLALVAALGLWLHRGIWGRKR